MTTFIKSAIRSLATSFAIVFALAPASVSAESLYWIGGAGTEDVPADIYDQNNWASGSYSGSSISRKPTASDNLYFKFAEPTYLTNSMENASSVAVCNEVNFNGGTCILVGTIRSASTFRLAQSGGTDLEFRVTEGGMLHSGGTLAIGCGKKATLTVDGGSVYSASIMRVGNGSNATLTIKNGTVELASDMILSQGGTGTVKLEGGILKTKCIKKGTSTGTFYFDGGTLQANAENDSNFIAANLGAYVQVLSGGGVVDANGKSIKIDKQLEGSGAMRLKGGGTITFGDNSNYTGGTIIELGTKVIANGDTKILDNLVIDGRAALAGGTYDVFVKSGLDEDSTDNITLVNCTADSRVCIDSDETTTKLVVTTGNDAITFKGGGTITLPNVDTLWTGNTTIELGTEVAVATEVAKEAVLRGLVIDGRTVLAGGTYDVLIASGLTVDDLENIKLRNCAEGSELAFDNEEMPTKIVVNLAEPTVVKENNSIIAFPGETLNDIKLADFTARMCGTYISPKYNELDSAKGYNKKFYNDDDNNLSSIVVEFQIIEGGNTKCVVVEFTNGVGGVHAKALGARVRADTPLGFQFLEQDKTTWHGTKKPVATSRTGTDYGACDFRYTIDGLKAWVLDSDMLWSDFSGYSSLTSSDSVCIRATGAYTLTVNVNVNVSKIDFKDASNTTLKIDEDKEFSADSYSGLGFVLNNGIFQKWGEGTVEMKFDQASRGVFTVNAGTLKAVGKRVPVSPAGSPIDGDPDETPRSNYLIDVKSGATYDVNGQTSVPATVRLAEGAHFISSADAEKTYGQTIQLILAGDADVTAHGNFGIIGQAINRLDLDAHKLTVNVAKNKEFMLSATTITGTGTISVESGRFCIRNADSEGKDCTISIGASGIFENNMHFKVKNFINAGKIDYQDKANGWGRGMLEVTGLFESKKASIPKLMLTGATVKARPGAVVTVLDAFVASGTVTIDASEITKEHLDEAADERIPVLTVPVSFQHLGVNWQVADSNISGLRTRWVTDEGGETKTLYICRSSGTRIIIR